MIAAAPLGLGATAFAVFALGLRHGADPDHLAAIDNLTRNGASLGRRTSRFFGAIFACGHSATVLSIAALAGILGSMMALPGTLLETIGTWTSIVTLFGVAVANVVQLRHAGARATSGLKTALMPPRLRAAGSPAAALLIGALFGLGFDTSSQVAAYALAFSAGAGAFGALAIGLAFSAGMAVTDTLDSLLVHALVARRPIDAVRAARTWIGAVTALALGVAGFELAQAFGWRSPLPDLAVSAILVASLAAVFAFVLAQGTVRATASSPTA